jgi:signal transduction histidine kinase
MKIHLSLKFKIFLLLSSVIFLSFAAALIIVSTSVKKDLTLNKIVNEKIEIYRSAKNLETALSNQKGFLTYFFLDGDVSWLSELGEYREIFKNELADVKKIVSEKDQKKLINEIDKIYSKYINSKDKVIKNYRESDAEKITSLHLKQRDMFFRLLRMCETFSNNQWKVVLNLKNELKEKTLSIKRLAVISVTAILTACIFTFWFISRKILEPLNKIAEENISGRKYESGDQIKKISMNFKDIKEKYNSTAYQLEKSRESLEQSERMALVGKLAAGVAHTIRNPFTSVKMRLFSLSRSLELTKNHEEDFQVISDEIARIDNIIQNFLEFSRLPKLKKENVLTYTIITSVIQLLEHRMKTYETELKYIKSRHDPVIYADSDRIKETLINLIINSCEAMEKGGEITITEKAKNGYVEIVLKDNGPGIPEEIKDKIFQPFFTTKDFGSGLGLSIVEKIITEHKGTIKTDSETERGTVFIITLPAGEKNND